MWSVTEPLIFVIVSFVIILFKMFTTKRKWEIYLHSDILNIELQVSSGNYAGEHSLCVTL